VGDGAGVEAMSDFPKTRHAMLRANYKHTGNGVCKGCSAPIEWWTTGKGKSIPMNPPAPGADANYAPVEPHWATCPNAKDFKGGDSAKAAPEKKSVLGPTAAQELGRLRARHNARVIVMVDDFGTTAYWRNGIPGEDLRHDLISAGNFVRSEIQKKETNKA
jgi:hypothetical protein